MKRADFTDKDVRRFWTMVRLIRAGKRYEWVKP